MVIETELPPEIERYRHLFKSRLQWHTKFVHGYSMPWHQQVWCEALEDFSIKRLLIVAPPKYGKSPIVGLDYLGWRIGNDPEGYHCIYVSNTATQADKFSVALRDTIAYNQRYRFLYGVEPDVGKGWSEAEWFVKRQNEADKDPTLRATGIGGPILGGTVEEIILDDIADQENMATAYQRKKLMDWIKTTAFSRLVPGLTRVVLICTRWHEQDPAAEFENEGWVVIHVPAIDEEGNSTYPEYWTLEDLIGESPSSAKNSLGLRRFEMMYQGRVLPAEGGIFQKEWWRYWKQGQAPWQYGIETSSYLPILGIVQSWDTAFKEKQQNDFSACTTWAILANGYYLLDMWRGKVDFPKLKLAAEALWRQWSPLAVLIEDAASGQSLIQELKTNTRMPVIAIKVDRDKQSRAHAATPTIEAGKVYLPEDAAWRPQFEYEHEVFPGGANDDMVDTTTQFLNWVRTHTFTATHQVSEVPRPSTWRQAG
uniref:Putative terminase n=1 Tax=viral metagenome TaxID=1070528 RepID=A0A6M3JA37_9ZZZZ